MKLKIWLRKIWGRRVAPFGLIIGCSILAMASHFLSCLMFYSIAFRYAPPPHDSSIFEMIRDADVGGQNLAPGFMFSIMGLCLYGIHRGILFVPLWGSYQSWLATTPWQFGKPLPLGRFQLGLQDAVAIAVFCVPFCLIGLEARLILTGIAIFLTAYVGSLCKTLWSTNQALLFWTIATFAVTNLIVPSTYLVFSVAATFAIALVLAYYGINQALKKLRENLRLSDSMVMTEPFNSSSVFGLPIGPVNREPWKPDTCFLGPAIFVTWAVFCITFFVFKSDPDFSMANFSPFLAFAVFGLAGHRLFRCLGFAPPYKRFSRGRWIIPGYDIIFVAPLVLAIAAFAAPVVFERIGMPVYCAAPITVGTLLWLYKVLPPNIETWKLTGQFRLSNYTAAIENQTRPRPSGSGSLSKR